VDMAAHLGADPLGKVKTMLKDKITKLLQDADTESVLAHCDKDIKEETDKKEKHQATIADFKADIESNTALQNTLTDQIDKLAAAIKDLDEAKDKSTKDRAATKDEYDAAEKTAKDGIMLMTTTINSLDTFYKTAAKKEKADETRTGFQDKATAAAAQAKSGKVDPFAKAPDAGFDTEDTYGSDSSGGNSIIAMMDVMRSDFVRTSKTFIDDNFKSKVANEQFQTESEVNRQEKLMVKKSKTSHRNEIKDRTNPDLENQKISEIELLGGADSRNKAGSIEALAALMTKCKPPSMTHAQRVAKREAEVASLTSAWDMLDKRKE